MRKPKNIRARPWLEKDVVEHMDSLLDKDSIVLETGSGGSTLWFSSRVQKVFSFEHDREWHDVLKKTIRDRSIENIEIIFDGNYPQHGIRNVKAGFDLMLVDGRGRVKSVETAYHLLKPGGFLVFDDSNRPRYRPAMDLLRRLGWKLTAKFSGDEGTVIWQKPMDNLEKGGF